MNSITNKIYHLYETSMENRKALMAEIMRRRQSGESPMTKEETAEFLMLRDAKVENNASFYEYTSICSSCVMKHLPTNRYSDDLQNLKEIHYINVEGYTNRPPDLKGKDTDFGVYFFQNVFYEKIKTRLQGLYPLYIIDRAATMHFNCFNIVDKYSKEPTGEIAIKCRLTIPIDGGTGHGMEYNRIVVPCYIIMWRKDITLHQSVLSHQLLRKEMYKADEDLRNIHPKGYGYDLELVADENEWLSFMSVYYMTDAMNFLKYSNYDGPG